MNSKRFITAAIVLPILFAYIYFLPPFPYFFALLLGVGMFAMREFYVMYKVSQKLYLPSILIGGILFYISCRHPTYFLDGIFLSLFLLLLLRLIAVGTPSGSMAEIGLLGVAICYDWLFPEAIRQLTLRGAEVLIRVSAYMDPWGATSPMDWWTIVNRCRAIENTAYVVAANQAASLRNYPPFSWPGGSMIIDFDGRILAQADPGPSEKIVVAPIDVVALRHARQTRQGHAFLSHLRSSTCQLPDDVGLKPSTWAPDRPSERTDSD